MNKIKMFTIEGDFDKDEEKVNSFIADKKVINISFSCETESMWAIIVILYEEVTN